MKMGEIKKSSGSDDFIEVSQSSRAISEKYGSSQDQADMHRMGKEQQLRRNFGFFSIFGFSMILLSTWEAQLGSSIFGLQNGGSAGMIYGYLVCAIGFGFVVASLAEMGSIQPLRAPTAGGQYHWVSEFAPKAYQRFLSYIVGWLCVLAWQTGAAASAFVAGQELQALIVLNHEGYDATKTWRLTLIVIAITALCGIFNTFLARRLPLVEGSVLILHILGFFAIIIPMWILAPRTPAKQVFTEFRNNGWSSQGLSVMVGIITPTVSLIGSDAATHMSEELQDASYTLPRAMIWTAAANGTMGFVMLLTLLFCLGDLDSVLESPVAQVGQPFVAVFEHGVQSKAGATVMTSILVIMASFCGISNIAASSRQLFAFSRDRGVPFASFFSYVPKGIDIPLNAVVLTLVVSALLALINIGSSTAYNNITSLGLGALLSSYLISIGCVTLKRWRNEKLLPRRFDLGRWGFTINIMSLLFLLFVFIMCFFPATPLPAPASMNWAILIYGVVMLFSLGFFWLKGRHVYHGPVEYLRRID
ncbi:amino acid transporter [Microthyrium microscopicum]|uniref:Amino acid transporter n=1 Tax=Microthyrium microscopicum TaxID=703497 RepID=A0A6A6UBG5_9PEZI|nr:amino acid transporter [Microthyrium microscopicum]